MAAMPSSDVVALCAALLNAEAEATRAKAVNADLTARVALLELQNEKMRRTPYGHRSERGQLLVDQLELGYEELEASASHNRLLDRVPGVDGIKTGYTVPAGFDLAASARRRDGAGGGRNGSERRVIVVVLGANRRGARPAHGQPARSGL